MTMKAETATAIPISKRGRPRLEVVKSASLRQRRWRDKKRGVAISRLDIVDNTG